jgi:membrane-associated phospholipid phosphatase
MHGRPIGLAAWLVLLGALYTVAVIAIWRFFVLTEHGQLLDTVALAGNWIGRRHIVSLVNTVLNTLSVLSLAVATAVVGFIALIRRRFAVAVVTVLLIGGANLTTQVLKLALTRPSLGVDTAREAAGNSLPSGHTTVAASVAVALVLALPARLRGVGGVVGAGFTALAGVATLSAGWHRPSDAVAALLVVGAWASAAGAVLVIAQRPADRDEAPHWPAVAVLVVAALGFFVVAALALRWTNQVITIPTDELSRRRLLAAYGGGAAGIAGTSALVMALVLATVHRVVPQSTVTPDVVSAKL